MICPIYSTRYLRYEVFVQVLKTIAKKRGRRSMSTTILHLFLVIRVFGVQLATPFKRSNKSLVI